MKQHVGSLHQKYEEAKSWASDTLREHTILLNSWEPLLRKLSSIPAKGELIPLLLKDGQCTVSPTLQDFVNDERVRRAALLSEKVSQRLRRQFSDLTLAYDKIVKDGGNLVETYNNAFATAKTDVADAANGLVEEIEAIVKKISSDYETNLGLPDIPKSVAAIAKTALLHTRNFLPSLMETATESSELLHKAVDQKNNVMESALNYLQRISAIESGLADIQPRLAALDIGADDGKALDVVGFPQLLPSVYGSVLVEILRRHEWDEKMTTDSSTLAEEMGIHKEEEERRRKRWLKMMNNHLQRDTLDAKAMGIEVNLKSQEHDWPHVTRNDVDEYLSTLNRIDGFEDAVKEVREALKSLDAPTKQQVRRTNAFKNGSVHDAAFGRNSLLLRGDDELLRSLQSDKSKLQDRLKGSESRIRKLEDLLHRQSQISKPPGGNVLGPSSGLGLERYATSPVFNHNPTPPKAQENLSRHSSISSRRFSANHAAEEKAFTQRIVKLEAELISEKTRAMQLQVASADHVKVRDDLRNQVEEATSTKKDLLDNFEAQQHEFDGERRLFGDENTKLKVRLEELEEELDRILGSHDNARVGIEERTRDLEIEIAKIRRDAAEEVQTANSRIEFLQNDHTIQRERAYKLERQVQDLQEEKAALGANFMALTVETQNRDATYEDHWRSLRATHLQLSDDKDVPDDFSSLVEALEVLAKRSINHQHELKQALETLRADSALAEARIEKHEHNYSALHKRLMIEQSQGSALRDEVGQHKAYIEVLQTELQDERQELRSLRSKFAAGETGSDALRSRVAEEETKVEGLSAQLAFANAHSEQTQAELASNIIHIELLENTIKTAESRLESRARRAEELSTMLFNHTDRLGRLLEHIGFTVTKQEEKMVVQKAPRVVSGSTMLVDQSQSMNRSMSAPLPTTQDGLLPDYLHWAMADDLNIETQSYDTFIRDMQTFDMDTFTEAIIKRVKEVEHTARKWQREAKAYRDKSHRAQLEGHEKIAYRSFKDGDLALFLPTRNQATRPWAAFNVGAPHYFLREQDSHKLRTRDWLLARISKVEERVVDLSKSITGIHPSSEHRRNSITSTSDGGTSFDDENPFELSDGLRWYLLDAQEEKPGAPTTPGLGKSTVASANVDAKGSIQRKKTSEESRATKTLTSLDSRRSSSASKKSLVGGTTTAVSTNTAAGAIHEGVSQLLGLDGTTSEITKPRPSSRPSSSSANKPSDAEDVRKHLLWGP